MVAAEHRLLQVCTHTHLLTLAPRLCLFENVSIWSLCQLAFFAFSFGGPFTSSLGSLWVLEKAQILRSDGQISTAVWPLPLWVCFLLPWPLKGDHLETRTETTARIVVKIHEVQFLTNVYVQQSAVAADHVFRSVFYMAVALCPAMTFCMILQCSLDPGFLQALLPWEPLTTSVGDRPQQTL